MKPCGTVASYARGCRCDRCRSTYSEYQKARYRRDIERRRAQSRAYKRANPERARESVRRSYQKNREQYVAQAREANRRRRRESPGLVNRWNREWRARNPDWRVAQNASRRANRMNPQAREYVNILRHDPCSYCGSVAGEIDHIEPLAAGGTNEWGNLTAACRSCNAKKNRSSLLAALL